MEDFEDVNHDACLLVLRRPAESNLERPPTTIRALKRGTSESTKNQHLAEERFDWEFTADSNAWLAEPAARFETVYPPDVARELSRVASRCTPVSDCFDVTVGIQVYHQRNVPKHVIATKAFHADRRKGKNWFPFITGNDVQRYFTVFHDDAFLFYNERLCDKRELSHYSEPRIVVQQIFWNRLSGSYEVPTEPSLYLNTLFSITRPRRTLDLPGLLAILNSRLMSAAYERWANRLFGDKFPKVSKLDLARLPIPVVTRTKARRLSEWGTELQTRWNGLKAITTEFHNIVGLAELPHKTRFHELAHVVLGHATEADTGLTDSDMTPRSLREVEAEAVALVCLEALGLPGAEHCRGYIQHWNQRRGSDPIPQRSAQRIFKAADQILKAGSGAENPR